MSSFQRNSAFLGLTLLVIFYTTSTDADELCLSPPSYGRCDLSFSKWFYNATSLRCQTFTYSGCGGNANVFPTEAACVARCGPSAIQCGEVACPSTCQVQTGDTGACDVCVCYDSTCQDVVCGSTETCRMVTGQCVNPVESCFQKPSCQPLIAPTTTPAIPCPLLDCVKPCPYGTNRDSRGCFTCVCFDPCLGYDCPVGQTCMMTANQCNGNTNCYDGALRYCGVAPSTPAMIAGPSSDAMLQCCQGAGVATSCQAMCVANFTVTTDNVNLMTICSDDFGKYLSCASNNKGVASCCERKAVSASCSNLCLGNVQITPQTNLQDYTTCLMSDGMNDVISCYQQAYTAPTTSASTTTSTTVATPKPTLPCPIPMCYFNCRLVRGANGCMTCDCTTNSSSTSTSTTTLPTTTSTPATTTTTVMPSTTTSTTTTTTTTTASTAAQVKVTTPTTTTSTTTTTTTIPTPTTTSVSTTTTTATTTTPTTTTTTTKPTTTTTPTTTSTTTTTNPTTTTTTVSTMNTQGITSLATPTMSSSSTTPRNTPNPSVSVATTTSTTTTTVSHAESVLLPCPKQQTNNRATYQDNLQAMPQLNCNSLGQYQPLQCNNDACRCVSMDGVTIPGRDNLTLAQAIDMCYPNGKTTGTMRINADFSIIAPGDAGNFKSEMSQQIADILNMNDTSVTVTKLEPGSVLVSFIIDSPPAQQITVQENLSAFQNTPALVQYKNKSYEATLVPMAQGDKPSPNAEPSTMDHQTYLLLVILIPVIGSILILFVIVGIICACQARKRDSYKRQTLVSQLSTMSTQFEIEKEKSNETTKKSKNNKTGRPKAVLSQYSTTPLQCDTKGGNDYTGDYDNKAFNDIKKVRLSGSSTPA